MMRPEFPLRLSHCAVITNRNPARQLKWTSGELLSDGIGRRDAGSSGN
jgi:hypothetical protein